MITVDPLTEGKRVIYKSEKDRKDSPIWDRTIEEFCSFHDHSTKIPDLTCFSLLL